METEVRVEITLSVDASVDKETIESRMRALIESSGEMDLMEINIQDESEIYSDGQ